MNEIVDRMRNLAVFLPEQRSAFNEAAGEIERLERHHALNLGWEIRARAAEAEIKQLRDALQGLIDFIEIDAIAIDPLALSIARQALALSQAEGKT